MSEPHADRRRVPPTIGLALLESLRDADTPDEDVPRESDLPLLLQRRLGLSRVVEDQIRRYAQLRDRDGLEVEEVSRLFELIARRPDARRVFAAAGRRLADRRLGEDRRGGLWTRPLPGAARRRLAFRQVRRMARDLNPGGSVSLDGRPAALVVEYCLPARALGSSEGCELFTGLIEAVLSRYRAKAGNITHASCEGRSEERCVWRLEPLD